MATVFLATLVVRFIWVPVDIVHRRAIGPRKIICCDSEKRECGVSNTFLKLRA